MKIKPMDDWWYTLSTVCKRFNRQVLLLLGIMEIGYNKIVSVVF